MLSYLMRARFFKLHNFALGSFAFCLASFSLIFALFGKEHSLLLVFFIAAIVAVIVQNVSFAAAFASECRCRRRDGERIGEWRALILMVHYFVPIHNLKVLNDRWRSAAAFQPSLSGDC